jgi:hypothetical protein
MHTRSLTFTSSTVGGAGKSVEGLFCCKTDGEDCETDINRQGENINSFPKPKYSSGHKISIGNG